MRLLAVVVVCAGCSTYVQHRAALVPHATPVQTTGQPAAWRGTASLGASNIADLWAPGVGNPDAGVAIPSKQLRGSLGLAITRNLSMTVFREEGLASSAQRIKPTLPPLDGQGLSGFGYGMQYSLPTGSPFTVGLALELTAWDVPWVEYSQCIDNCEGQPIVSRSTGTTGVMSWGFGVVPSYQHGDWTFFGGITGRTHPTIEEKVINNGEWPDVHEGPMNAIVHGGAAYEAGERVKFVVEMHHSLTADPVAYAPGIGFSMVIGLGRRFPKVARPPPPVLMMPAAPGAATPYPAPYATASPAERRAQAERFTKEAQELAERGECPRVRAFDARVRVLDPEYHDTVFMRDALIAYCVTP